MRTPTCVVKLFKVIVELLFLVKLALLVSHLGHVPEVLLLVLILQFLYLVVMSCFLQLVLIANNLQLVLVGLNMHQILVPQCLEILLLLLRLNLVVRTHLVHFLVEFVDLPPEFGVSLVVIHAHFSLVCLKLVFVVLF